MATIRDIAARLGLSKSAVSLAFRDHPRISPKTRERVLAAARELGYRPNPVFAQMMRAVRSSGPVHARAIVGILHGFSDPQPARSVPFHGEWVAGARARAEGLGYLVNEIWMTQPGMSARRLSAVIQARGINSVVIAPLPERRRVELDWKQFSAVGAGLFLVEPRLSRVVPNHQQGMIVCLQQLMARGYTRIGLALESWLEPFASFHFSAPFLWYLEQIPAARRVPIFRQDGRGRGGFSSWFRRYKPDAVIVTGIQGVSWLRSCGAEIPQDVGVVFTQSTSAPPGYCSVDEQPRRMGAAAIDLLLVQMNHSEFGLPANPKTVFTDIGWIEGESLRQVGPAVTAPRLDFS